MVLVEGVDYKNIEKTKDGFKYKLLKTQNTQTNLLGYSVHHKYIHLYEDGKLTVEKGYLWDGASGGADTDNFMRASLIHDALCDCYQYSWLPQTFNVRLLIDKELYRICRADGMWLVRAWWVYFAVRRYSRLRYGIS